MTFDEFKALAERLPSLDGNWLYRLTHQTLSDDFSYPEFGIYVYKYMFLSLAEAEIILSYDLLSERHRLMLRTFNDITGTKSERGLPELSNTFGYQISRLGFGPHGTRDFYIQYWMYDSEQKELDRSSCSSYHWNMPGVYGKFLGRLPEDIRFREGDIVEISISRGKDVGKCCSTLGVIIGTPLTVREQWEQAKDGINRLAEEGEPNPIEKYFEAPDCRGVDIEEYFILYGPYEEPMMYAAFQHPQEVRPPLAFTATPMASKNR